MDEEKKFKNIFPLHWLFDSKLISELLIYIMIVSSSLDYMALNNRISEFWIGKDMEGSSNGIIYSTKYPRTGENYKKYQWGPPMYEALVVPT